MYPHELPQVDPRWHPRPLLASEVVRLATGEDVPGINPHDPRVQGIRRCVLGNLGHLAFSEARRRGFLRYATDDTLGTMTSDVVTVWSWWCTAARHPELILHRGRGSDDIRLTCDLSPTGRVLTAAALPTLGRAIAETHTEDDWLLTRETIDVGGLTNEDALALADTLLALAQDRRQTVDCA